MYVCMYVCMLELQNTCNSNEVVIIKKSLKRGCRCGDGKKGKGAREQNASHKSCQDGLRKYKCSCATGGIGCTEACRCFNCGNFFKLELTREKPLKRKKRNRATVSPWKKG